MSNSIPERIYIYRSPKTGVMDGDWARDKSLPGDILYIRAEAVAKEREELVAALESLAAYADSVRVDRKDESGEFALQTVDWCEGLNEKVELAFQLLSKQEGGAK